DHRDRTLAVPDFPDDYQGKTSYNIHGQGGSYVIAPNEHTHGMTLVTDGDSPSTWLINTTNMDKDGLSLHTNGVSLGGQFIKIEDYGSDRLLVLNNDGDTLMVTLGDHPSSQVVAVDADKVDGLSTDSLSLGDHMEKYQDGLKSHLQGEYQAGKFANGRVSVTNYRDPSNHKFTQVYYDGATDNFYYDYSWYNDSDIQENSALVAVDSQGRGLMLNSQKGFIYVVSPETNSVDETLVLPLMETYDADSQIYSIIKWEFDAVEQDGDLWIQGAYTNDNDVNATLQARIDLDSVGDFEITHIGGSEYLFNWLMDNPNPNPWENPLENLPQPWDAPPTPGISATLSDWVILAYDNDIIWYRNEDDTTVHLNLDHFPHGQTPEGLPDDIALINTLMTGDGEEVFVFHSESTHGLYLQTGALGNDPSKLFYYGGIASVGFSDDLIITTDMTGRLHRVDIDGTMGLMGFTAEWMENHVDDWYETIASDAVADENSASTLLIDGVFDAQGNSMGIWYDLQNQRMVATQVSQGEDYLQYLGPHTDGTALIYDADARRLFTQAVLSEDDLVGLFEADVDGDGNTVGIQLAGDTQLPAAVEMFPGETILSLDQAGSGWQVATSGYKIFGVGFNEDPQLIGVTPEWDSLHNMEYKGGYYDLANQYHGNVGESIAIYGRNGMQETVLSGWYHVVSGSFLDTAVLPQQIREPVWFGARLVEGTYFILDANDNSLWQIGAGGGGIKYGNYGYINRLQGYMPDANDPEDKSVPQGDALLIQGDNNGNTLRFPTLDAVFSVVLSGEGGADTYEISLANLKWYSNIVIDNTAQDAAQDRILLDENLDLTALEAALDGDDVIITDTNLDKSITIRNGADSSIYSSLVLESAQGDQTELIDIVTQLTADSLGQLQVSVFSKNNPLDTGEEKGALPGSADVQRAMELLTTEMAKLGADSEESLSTDEKSDSTPNNLVAPRV
ncbi:MAG: hypothetical protein MI747_14450, partial [Desulfobacterales bacterium]|nr:hypothetical protein [Desulfobacterales bacterium]